MGWVGFGWVGSNILDPCQSLRYSSLPPCEVGTWAKGESMLLNFFQSVVIMFKALWITFSSPDLAECSASSRQASPGTSPVSVIVIFLAKTRVVLVNIVNVLCIINS